MDTATTTPTTTDVSVTSDSSTPPVVVINTSPADKKPTGSWGSLFSIIAMLALIIFAALYVWGERVADEGVVVPSEVEVVQ